MAAFISSYLDNGSGVPDNWKDPVTGAVYVGTVNPPSAPTATGNFQYVTNATCNGEVPQTGAGARKVAIQMKLEGAGYLCQSN
jgi:hypothetical protein